MSPPHPRVARAALLTLLLGLLTLVAAPAGADEHEDGAEEVEATPLTVRLTAMSPAIPARGRVVLRGVVTNSSPDEWRDINVHPFISRSPLTTRAELVEAAALPETTDVGDRLTEVGQFADIGDLDPGESTAFVIRLPRDVLDISGAPGVHWIGVHALGLSPEGRDGTADGRARAFIPLVAGQGVSTSVAVVLPLREPVRRAVDGRIIDGDDWAESLEDQGRLGRILGIAEGAGSAPFSWLVDPAVLDAAADIAAGNPRLSYGEPNPEPDGEASPSPSAQGASFRVSRTTAAAADTWLDRLTASARSRTVLGLPYADPDAAALLRLRPPMLDRALRLGQDAFQSRDLTAATTFAPPSGFVSPEIQQSDQASVVLGSDRGEDVETSSLTLPGGSHLVLADRRAASGGPLPTRAMAALALRQRILSEAALRALAGTTEPMPVLIPAQWDPGLDWESAAFFEGLQRPWLSLVPLDPDPDTDPPAPDGALPYPEGERAAEIGAGEIAAAGSLINAGALLEEVLDTDNDVFDTVAGSALSATSYAARTDASLPALVRARAGALNSELAGVKVLGTEFNTLSSGAGRLTVSVVNELDQPVKVILRVDADPGLQVDTPEPVQIGPDQRTTLRLQATADNIGVHDVTLTPVTEKGQPFGTPLEMTVRTSQVGMLIWIVLAAGGGLFVVMIIRRIVQRIRSHRWKPAPVESA